MLGIIGGTGLGEALFGEIAGQERVIDTPFGRPSSPVRLVAWHGLEIALLARHGEGHLLNPSQVPYRANIYALKTLGVTAVIASGAVGSLREDIRPRELVLVDQFIDRTTRRPSTFFDEGLAVHVEFAEPVCPELHRRLSAAAAGLGTTVHPRGTYVCMEGPAFSTRAEAELHRAWGADLIGMTALPEARLAREAEMSYALVALVTDYDCWRPHDGNADARGERSVGVPPVKHRPSTDKRRLLEEILDNVRAATANAIALIRAVVESLAQCPLGHTAAHDALELAIWSDRAQIPPAAASRYGPLLARYLKSG